MQIALPAHPPFQFRSIVHSHGWYQLAPFTWDEAGERLHKVERLQSGRVISLAISGHTEGVNATVKGRLTVQERQEVTAKVTWMFNLEANFSAFYALADAEPRLAHCRPKALGRLLRSSSLFEDVAKVMMTTNIQWSGAKRLTAALVNAFGEPLPEDNSHRAFPTAAALAQSDEATLRQLGLGYRAPYLLKLARGVVAGDYALEQLTDSTRPTADVRRDLLVLPGIGPYAAATLLGFLGRYDFIGVDSAAVSAVSKAFYGSQPVGEKEVYAVFDKWGPYKALAYWFWDFAGQQQVPMEAWETGSKQK